MHVQDRRTAPNLLIDVDRDGCEHLAARLRAQDFAVDTAYDGVSGAEMALTSPPSIVIADLWMPGVSGVQLCRLLRAEPATADAAFILRAEHDDPKNRFWAERAGAAALVSKGRMGELVRLLTRLAAAPPSGGSFFTHLGAGPHHIRDRIAEHLDAALFESVIAAEVRALATASSLEWLFEGEGGDALIDRADRAMYAATTAGRNRVELAPEPFRDVSDRAA